MYEENVFSCLKNAVNYFYWSEIQVYFEVEVETFNSAWIQADNDWAAWSPQLFQMMKTSQNSPAICLGRLGWWCWWCWWCWGASLKRRMQTTPIPDGPLGGAVAGVADPSAGFSLTVLPAASHLQPARRRTAVATQKAKGRPQQRQTGSNGRSDITTGAACFNDVGWLSSGLRLV